jgi:hypothetical protein
MELPPPTARVQERSRLIEAAAHDLTHQLLELDSGDKWPRQALHRAAMLAASLHMAITEIEGGCDGADEWNIAQTMLPHLIDRIVELGPVAAPMIDIAVHARMVLSCGGPARGNA